MQASEAADERNGARADREGSGSESAHGPVRLIVVSARAEDAARIVDALRRGGAAPFVHESCSAARLDQLLGVGSRDAILAVDQPPESDALDLLLRLERSGCDAPCLVVTNADDDGRYVDLLRAGARDCIPIDHLPRLGPALERELRSARDRDSFRRAEKSIAGLFEGVTGDGKATDRGFLVTVLEDLPVGVSVLRASDLAFLFVNRVYRGIAPGKVMPGRTYAEVFPEIYPSIRGVLERVVATGEPFEAVDQRFPVRRGPEQPPEEAYFTWSLHRIPLPGDEGWGFVTTVWETTDRRRNEEALRANVHRLGLAMEAAEAGWWEWNLETNENVWSEELWRLYGLDPRSTKPSYEAWRSSIHPDDVAATEEAVERAARTGSELLAEWRVRTGDGHERRLVSRGRPRKGPDGCATHFVGVVIDVTDRRRAEQTLRESEERFRSVVEQAADAMFVHDFEGRFVTVNRRACETLGYTRDELLSLTVTDIEQDFDLPAAQAAWSRIEPDQPFTLRGHQRCKDGSVFPVEVRFGRFNMGGRALFLGLVRDVTERVEAERALRERAERLRTFFESPVFGTLAGDIHGRVVDANDEFLRIVGYSRADLEAGKIRWDSLTPPEYLPLDWAHLAEAREKGATAPYEKQYVRGDGSRVWVLVGFTLVGSAREESVAFVLDISERKAAEEAVKESRATLAAALASMSDAVFISDASGRFVEFNEAFATFHRFRDKSECSRYLEDYPAILDVFLENGELAPLSMWAVPRALRGETATNAEYTLRRKDTGESWIGSYNFSPIRDAGGTIVGSVVVGSDITVRKRNELEIRKLNEELETRVRERTEELEGFSYSVSHDLRAPLRAINGFARLLEEEHSAALNVEGKRLLGVVQRNARQMGQLIDDLLAFSRIGRAEICRSGADMNALVRAAWAEVAGDAPTAVDLVLGDLPPTVGDPGLLRQVWVNYLSNAVKFSARSGPPRIRVSGRLENGAAVYEVSDNGVGFEPAYGHKLFHVFQRLHGQQEFPGTGIGLALVERIVGRHGGTVHAVGTPGKGATFTFSLPSPARRS